MKDLIRQILREESQSKFEEFAQKRLEGATKITENAKEKGGPAMLTYHHFVVKLPHYKRAAEGKFDIDKSGKAMASVEGSKLEPLLFEGIIGKN